MNDKIPMYKNPWRIATDFYLLRISTYFNKSLICAVV
jgi:hypothetical protein